MNRQQRVFRSILGRAEEVLIETRTDSAIRELVRNSASQYVRDLQDLAECRGRSAFVNRRKVFHILRSFHAKLCCLILGWNRSPISYSDACLLASELNPRLDCGEAVSVRLLEKPDGGVRPVCSFGPKRRALQLLVKHVLEAQWGKPKFDFAYKGRGREAAMTNVITTTAKKGGSRWFLIADIKNCFGSFDQDKILGCIPLPRAVIRHSVLIPETAQEKIHIEATSSKAVVSGLPQGSLASSYIASKLIEPVLEKLQGSLVLSYADDIIVGCKTKADAQANELLLGGLLADHRAGPLFMKSRVARLGKPIDFLSYRLRRRWLRYGGGLRTTPSGTAFRRFEERLLHKLSKARVEKFNDTATDYVQHWKQAHPLWDRSEAGDQLLDLTVYHVLAAARHKERKQDACDVISFT